MTGEVATASRRHRDYEIELRQRGWIDMQGQPVYPRRPISGHLIEFAEWANLTLYPDESLAISFTVRVS